MPREGGTPPTGDRRMAGVVAARRGMQPIRQHVSDKQLVALIYIHTHATQRPDAPAPLGIGPGAPGDSTDPRTPRSPTWWRHNASGRQ